MKLIADSGSTKTEWCINDSEKLIFTIKTQGINPFHQNEESIEEILRTELIPSLSSQLGSKFSAIDSIEFYGAGCNAQKAPIVHNVLSCIFPSCHDITVDSDMLGAAKALCHDSEGIACILGTGANSCLYDGRYIVSNVSPMGYILGDEGSGAVIGKTFVNELYKGVHRSFIHTFESEMQLTQADIIQRVYREPLPNRFLASLCPFLSAHINKQEWIADMVTDCFRLFFRKNIIHYGRKDLPVHFVGSIAFHFRNQLTEAADLEGFKIGRILQSPLSHQEE